MRVVLRGLPHRRAEKLCLSGSFPKIQRGCAADPSRTRRHSRRNVYISPEKHSFSARREEFAFGILRSLAKWLLIILEVKVGFPF
jgi:hypothetical protein